MPESDKGPGFFFETQCIKLPQQITFKQQFTRQPPDHRSDSTVVVLL